MKILYSDLKFLQFPKHLEALRAKEIVAPVHIRIKPINACNHDCWYCAYHVDWLQLGNLMEYKDILPKPKMFEIIDDAIKMGVKAVTFTGGGEPLMYPSIVECVEKLTNGGIKVAVITNGSRLKGKIAEVFAQHGTWVRISIDAWDGPSYAKSRSIKEDEFDRVIQNIRDFVNLKPKAVLGISFIIDNNNYDHIYQFSKLMKDVGVSHVKMSGCVVSNDGVKNNEYHQEIQDTVRGEIEKCDELCDENFQIIDHYHQMEERFNKSYTTCPFLQYLTVIGADGKVYACQDKAYTHEGLMGSIEKKSFKEYWYSEENKQRVYSLDPSVSCRHHCVAHQKNISILNHLNTDENHGFFV
jgi:Fe-coproporphyrin III synthase